MLKLTLIRDIDSGKSTIGRLYCEGEFLCFTLENTWADNQPRISCIPEGTYDLTTKTYGRFYDRYDHPIVVVKNVPGRSEILFHKGNTSSETAGCILVGMEKGVDVIYKSSLAYNKIYPIISVAKKIIITNETT